MKSLDRPRLWLLAASGAIAALLAAAVSQRDVILFNHSPSMPVGFYLRTGEPVTRGVVVTVRARDVASEEAQRRGFAEPGDRFIKRVAAAAGDEVCGDGERVTINGAVAAERYASTAHTLGWRGCRILAEGEVLLLGESADSFDGRYWGPTRVEWIEGVWRQL